MPSSPRPDPSLEPPPFARSPWYVRALWTGVAIAIATLARYWLDRRFGLHLHSLTYFPTVFIVASLLGTVEGIYATIAATILALGNYFPASAQHGTPVGGYVSLAFFFLSGVVVSIVSGALRSRTYRMHRALEELRDIHQRIGEEQRHLYETTTRLDTIVASAEEAIIGKDIHGIVTSWNKGAETIFGYTAEEMVGRSIHSLLPPDQQSEEGEVLALILRGETVQRFNSIRIRKDGQAVHLNLTVSPIRDVQGNIVGASKVARDITERLKLQKQLQQSQKMEAVGQLAGGIAHDFNNLLAIILGALELQRDSIAQNSGALHRWEVANRAARRGAELTRRLLAFSSMEHFKIAPTDLNHSIRNTMEMAMRLIGPEIKVALNLEKSIPGILVDPSGLESAVLNMVINARDAMMPKGGTLTVSTRSAELEESFTATLTGAIKPGAYACISISDTGCGMSPEVLDRSCEPFFTTKGRGRGTGLGLSMVYGFVKHSGGGIRIYSEVGYGTTITFYLPFDRNAASIARPAAEAKPDGKRSGTILIVDDEAELLEISVTYLAACGYTVLSAGDAKEALHILKERGPIDVMVTDIVMGGGIDGMELAQVVHRLSPETRVIYSSGFPADALSERSLPLADSLVLQKPYRLAELGASIDQAIGLGANPDEAAGAGQVTRDPPG